MASAKQSKLMPLPATPLPGGYAVGEKLYYIGSSQTFENGDRVVHGEQVEVMGPATGEWEGLLLIQFPNNNDDKACPLEELSRSPPPPLPGGYKLGEKLYFIGGSETFHDGDRLVHGEQGEVMGPSTKTKGNLLIKFPNNTGNIGCMLENLSRSPPPPLPGGYAVGEKLFHWRELPVPDNGDRVVHGEQGEVVGPGTDEGRLAIKFADRSKSTFGCLLDTLSRSPPPPLPGGYAVGDKLYYIGLSHTYDDGDRLVYGEQGEVMGPSMEREQEGWLDMMFAGNMYPKGLEIVFLSRSPPPPLPDGHTLGEKLYYIGSSHTVRLATASHTAKWAR